MKLWYIVAIVLVLGIAVTAFMLTRPRPTGYAVLPSSEHVRGSDTAKVTITEFSDFQCPYCGNAQPVLEEILKNYQGKVKLVYKHFPLQFHQYAEKAAEASECAADQGKFWEYHDLLFGNQDSLTKSDLKNYAEQIGLDMDKFNSCLDSGIMAERVKNDLNEGIKLGVSGTPAFFINGQKVIGAQPYFVFQSAIERALS